MYRISIIEQMYGIYSNRTGVLLLSEAAVVYLAGQHQEDILMMRY
jgi:hypothetical protein